MTVLLMNRHEKLLAWNRPHCSAMLLSSKLLLLTVSALPLVPIVEVFSEFTSRPFEKLLRKRLSEIVPVPITDAFCVVIRRPLPPAGDTGTLACLNALPVTVNVDKVPLVIVSLKLCS